MLLISALQSVMELPYVLYSIPNLSLFHMILWWMSH